MSRPEDTFTSTVDAAAAFERHHAPEPDDDRPTLTDVMDEPPSGKCDTCGEDEYLVDGLCVRCWEPPTCRGCGGIDGHRGRCV